MWIVSRAIEEVTDVPLVIHGGSGVPVLQRTWLSQNSKICKFNIGTELRSSFGNALRKAMNSIQTALTEFRY